MRYSISNMFTLDYWFNLNPTLYVGDTTFEIMLYLFTFFFVFGISIRIYVRLKNMSKIQSVFYKEIGGTIMVFGVLSLLWFFFRYQNAYFISMRLVFVLILIWFIYSINDKIKDYKYQLNRLASLKANKADAYKYIPKKKKK